MPGLRKFRVGTDQYHTACDVQNLIRESCMDQGSSLWPTWTGGLGLHQVLDFISDNAIGGLSKIT